MAKILVIDDESQIREMIKSYFDKRGFKTKIAKDGLEGLKIMEKNPIKVVVTDIYMPEKDGLETIRELRENYPNINIIAISGGMRNIHDKTRYDHLFDSFMVGSDCTYTKPVDLDKLLTTVKSMLS